MYKRRITKVFNKVADGIIKQAKKKQKYELIVDSELIVDKQYTIKCEEELKHYKEAYTERANERKQVIENFKDSVENNKMFETLDSLIEDNNKALKSISDELDNLISDSDDNNTVKSLIDELNEILE